MKQAMWVDAAAMARDVFDGALVVLSGSGGGLQEADHIAAAIEKRFLETGHPKNLTLVHGLGIGDGIASGITRFAHKGMIKRVIGGHWTWSRRMQQLARDNEIEAYTLPAGPIQTMLREWAYAASYRTSTHRARALPAWIDYYNHHRPHGALGHKTPASRHQAD